MVLNAGIRSAHELAFWRPDAAHSPPAPGGPLLGGPALGRSESGKEVVAGSPQWLPMQIGLRVDQDNGSVTVTQVMMRTCSQEDLVGMLLAWCPLAGFNEVPQTQGSNLLNHW